MNIEPRNERGEMTMPAALAGFIIGTLIITMLSTFWVQMQGAAEASMTRSLSSTEALRATNQMAREIGDGVVVEHSESHVVVQNPATDDTVTFEVTLGDLNRVEGETTKTLATGVDSDLFTVKDSRGAIATEETRGQVLVTISLRAVNDSGQETAFETSVAGVVR